jgi:hypothetical protein
VSYELNGVDNHMASMREIIGIFLGGAVNCEMLLNQLCGRDGMSE